MASRVARIAPALRGPRPSLIASSSIAKLTATGSTAGVIAVRGFAAASASSYVTFDEGSQNLNDLTAKSPKLIAYFTARSVVCC